MQALHFSLPKVVVSDWLDRYGRRSLATPIKPTLTPEVGKLKSISNNDSS